MTIKPQKQPKTNLRSSKKPLALLLCLIVVGFGYGQNLVGNPSFEDTIANPLGGTIDDATGWINCYLSPDYYNAGFNTYSPDFGVPNCSYTGYQHALYGNAFAGIGLTQVPEQPGEFMGVQLTQPLTIGTKYHVSAYISRADNFICSSNNFGFRFFNSLYFLPSFNSPPIDDFAHVNSTALITDSVGWNFISGSFIEVQTISTFSLEQVSACLWLMVELVQAQEE